MEVVKNYDKRMALLKRLWNPIKKPTANNNNNNKKRR